MMLHSADLAFVYFNDYSLSSNLALFLELLVKEDEAYFAAVQQPLANSLR